MRYQAALLLDHPIVKVQEASLIILDEMNTDKQTPEESNHESESGRKLRLQLRHRFLACIRSKRCIFDLGNALLTIWGLPNISKVAPKPKKRKKTDMAGTTKTSPPRKKKKVEAAVPHNVGYWNRDERVAFLEGLEQFGAPHWIKIAPLISTRYVLLSDGIDIMCEMFRYWQRNFFLKFLMIYMYFKITHAGDRLWTIDGEEVYFGT